MRKPRNFLRYRINTKSKTQNSKMIYRQQWSLSLLSQSYSFSLSYALQLSVSECVINREAHSLFILVSDLTLTHQGRLLQESLITLVPHNCGDFSPDQQGGLTSMNLHELITLIILLIGTFEANQIQYMKYISEYILKLKIHQQWFGHLLI